MSDLPNTPDARGSRAVALPLRLTEAPGSSASPRTEPTRSDAGERKGAVPAEATRTRSAAARPGVLVGWLGRLGSAGQHLAAAGGQLSAGQRGLLSLGLVLGSLLLLLIPLPGIVLDLFLGLSFALSLSLLIGSVRAGEPLRMPQLPSLLLLSVLLRLGLNLAGLRAILSAQTDPSFLISEGGSLFFAGDVLVGALIMLGFAIVEYLVLARGGERVAEVAARFVLDALPGRQASIEADLRSGAITQGQAQERRATLDHEAQIYGALDGSFRLLRGDVAAALLLLGAGLVFAIGLGVVRQGLEIGEAAERYVTLVLSQALWTQVPVLLNVAAAGLLLTRAGAQDPQSTATRAAAEGPSDLWIDVGAAVPLDADALLTVQTQLAARLGFAPPAFALRSTEAVANAPRSVTVWLYGARLARFSASTPAEAQGQLLQALLAAAADLLTLDGVQAQLVALQQQAPALLRETMPRRIDLGRLTAVLRRLVAQRVWPLDLRAVLEVLAMLPKPETDVAALVEQLRGGLGRFLLQGFLRPGLSDGAMTPLAGSGSLGDGLPALLIATDIESMLRESLRPDGGGRLEPDLVRDIVQGAVSAKQMAPDAVLLCHADVRRTLEDLLLATPEVLPIFAYSEVPASVRVIVMGRVEPGGEHATPVVDSSAVPWQMRTRL